LLVAPHEALVPAGVDQLAFSHKLPPLAMLTVARVQAHKAAGAQA
jgi:hypothetical protein